MDRRTQLLRVSLRLFREHGYHGTGINDIGLAAGVTGPAIYRHFRNKDDVLVQAILEGGRRLGEAAKEVLAADLVPADALVELCRSYVRVAIEDPDLIAVFLLEARHLPLERRAPLRRRSRLYAEEFVHRLTMARPELSDAEATTLVRAALYMVASITLDEPMLDSARLEELLTDRMAALLLSPPMG